MLSKLVASALAALLSCTVPADVVAQQLPLQYLTQQDGLGNLSVSALTQDHAGYLWVGTDNGLFRYNGAEFKRYAQDAGLVETQITAVLADRVGRLWVGTLDNLYLRVGERLHPVMIRERGLSVNAGQSLADRPGGGIILVSEGQLFQIFEQGGRFVVQRFFSAMQRQLMPALDKIDSVMSETGGGLWMGCDQSLCSQGPRGTTVWGADAGVPADQWLNLYKAADGVLWVRGKRHVIVLEPGKSRFIDRTPPGDAMRKVAVATSLAEDVEHRILINTDHGVARWQEGRWVFWGATNGLKMGGGVPAMLVDRYHGLWLGTGGHGLARWMGYDNWENWGGAQGLPDDNVFAFLRDEAGRMRIGTRSGLVMLANRDSTRAVPVPGYRTEQWSSMALDGKGQLWTGSYVGSLMRENSRSGVVAQVAALPMIFKLLTDRQGRLWISTGEGLYVIEHPGTASLPTRPAGLPAASELLQDQTRRSCQSSDGTLWFLTEFKLWRLQGEHWDSYTLRSMRDAEFDGLACSADGTLWLGQGPNGLWHAQVDASGLVKRLLATPLLRDKTLLTIHEDRHGWLWLGTDVGLVVWNRREWHQFDSSDGLVWNDLNARPVYEDADGTIWLASSNGVSHVIHPERLFDPYPLSTIVESAERDGTALDLHDGDQLPWSSGVLHLRMASLNYQHRNALRFRYRLAGLEQEWTSTTMPHLRYAALPPGEYRLQYAVENLDTQSESAMRELRFTILPPWWLTRWFILLCGAVAVAALWQLYRYRVRGLHLRNTEMENLVQARTKELEARTRELELSQESLRERALKDGLTKAWNRAAILEMLEQAILRSQRDATSFLLCLLDLDYFKRINDTYGHLAGDAVLRDLVQRLNGCVRPYDLVGRYGGEEFLVLMIDLNLEKGVTRVEAMRAAVEATPFDIGEQRMLAVTASFGVAEFDPTTPVTGLELVRRADLALYRAKELGRNRVEYAGVADS